MILTAAAGSVRDDLETGSIVVVEDHLNLTGQSPLGGPVFVDLVDAYAPALRTLALAAPEPAAAVLASRPGVYAQVHGPQFETPAEVRMLRSAGADVVGMSMAIETIAARHGGAEVLGLALVTNVAAGSGAQAEVGAISSVGRCGRAARGRGGPPRRRLVAMSSPVAPAGVDHVAINVPDVPGAIAFYTEQLGLVQNFTRPDFGFAGAWLDTASGQQVHLIELPAPPNVGQHFALVFADLDAVVGALRDRGLEVTDPVAVGDTGRRQAFTSDPWGNGIELHQRA